MKVKKKSLLLLCVLTSLSTSVLAETVTETRTHTTVVNEDTAHSSKTTISREQYSSSVSTESTSYSTSSSSSSTHVGVGVGIGRVGYGSAIDIFMPVAGAVKAPPAAVKKTLSMLSDDTLNKQGYLGLVKEKGKWGIVGTNGDVLLPPTYQSLEASFDYDGTFFGKEGKNKYVHIKGDGTVLTSGQEAEAEVYTNAAMRKSLVDATMDFDPKGVAQTYDSDNYVAFLEGSKYGFKDRSGAVVIAPQFKEVYNGFSEDRAFVKLNGETVAIDGSGTVLFKAPSNEVYPYHNGLAEYRRKVRRFGLGNLIGLVGIGYWGHHYGGGLYLGEGISFTEDGQKRGYIDRAGQIVVDSKNDYVYPMEKHGTLVRNEGKLGFVNRKGQYIIEPGNYTAGTIDMNNILLTLKNKDTNKYGIFDMETGKQEVPFSHDSIDFVGPHHMAVTKDNKAHVVDMIDGRVIYTGPADTKVTVFAGDTYSWIHSKADGYRILSLDGTVVTTPIMKDISGISAFTHGYSGVKIKGKWGIINTKGELVVQPSYDEVKVL